jgi:hypothetical protein
MTCEEDVKRIRDGLLNESYDRQTLMYALGIFAAIACVGIVLIWR